MIRYEIQTIAISERKQESERKRIQKNRQAVKLLEQERGLKYFYKGKPTKRYKKLAKMREEYYTSASL